MQPLSGLDSPFLHLETAATPMHVGAPSLLEAAAARRGEHPGSVELSVAADDAKPDDVVRAIRPAAAPRARSAGRRAPPRPRAPARSPRTTAQA